MAANLMTARERVERAFRHEAPDRTPIFEYVIMGPVADALLGRPYLADPVHRIKHWTPGLWEAAVRQEALDHVELALILGHDMMYVVPPPPPPGWAWPTPAPVDDDEPVERIQARNLMRREFSGHPQERFLIFDFIHDEMQRRGVDLPIYVPTYDHGVFDDADLMMTMLLEPEVAAEHFQHATRSAMDLIDRYLKAGVDIVGVGGDFSGNHPLISPECYRTFIVPEVRELSRRLRAEGKWSVNASDGNLWPVIEDFLFGCEVDAYAEIDMHAGMDLRRLKAEFGDRITLIGNLDCGNVLSFGSEDTVRRHVIECLEAGQGKGGHILTASNAITASVPLRNYVALVNAYREFYGLPLLSPPE